MLKITTIITILVLLSFQQLVAQVSIVTYYPNYDSVGLATPIKESFFVTKKDSSVKQGKYLKFSPEGDTLSLYHYKKGLKDGLCIDYYENGIQKYRAMFDNGQKSGDAFYFKITGELIVKETFTPLTKGKKNIFGYTQFNPDNKLLAKGFIVDGFFDSTYVEFYLSGKLKSITRYSTKQKNGRFEVLKEDGVLLQEGTYKDGVLDGTVNSYYPTSIKKTESVYSNGNLNGNVKEFFPDGTLKFDGLYQDNTQHGLTKTYFDTGALRTEEFYVNGLLNGFYKTYHPNGQLESECFMKGTKKSGKVKEYNSEGVLTLEVDLQNGIPDGKSNAYYNNAEKKYELQYEKGKKVGENRYYYLSGGLSKVENYSKESSSFITKLYRENGLLEAVQEFSFKDTKKEGKPVKTGTWTWYHPTKKISTKEQYERDKLNGDRLIFNEKGILIESQVYTFDIKAGLWKVFYESGKLLSETTYKNNLLYGSFKSYFENGLVEQEGAYINSKKTGLWKYYSNTGKVIKRDQWKNGELVVPEPKSPVKKK